MRGGARATLRRRTRDPVPIATAAVLATIVAVVVTAGVVAGYRRTAVALTLPESRAAAGWLVLAMTGLGAATLGAWLVRRDKPQVATGLAVAICGAVLPFLAAWSALPFPVRATAPAAAAVVVPGLAAAGSGWAARGPRHLLLPCYGLGTLAASVRALAYNPFEDPDCVRICRDVRPLLDGSVSWTTAVHASALLSLLAAALALAAITVTKLAPAGVQSTSTVVVAGLWLTPLTDLGLLPPVVHVETIWVPWGVGAVGLAVLVAHARTLATRLALDRLIRNLDQIDPASPRTVLEGAIVHFQRDGSWVDTRGERVPAQVAGPVLSLPDDDGSVTRLVLRPGARPELLTASLTPARRLALNNARIAAWSRAQLLEVRAAQLRTVQRSDAERRRIERDLHDGAQQNLVGAAIQLGIAGSRMDHDSATVVADAREELWRSLERLRNISRGPVPSLLVDEGLETALDELVRTSDVPARLLVDPATEVGFDAAHAAYLMVKAWLEPARSEDRPETADIEIRQETERLTIVVTSEYFDGVEALTALPIDVLDRLGALGGHHVVQTAGQTRRLEVVIPCAS